MFRRDPTPDHRRYPGVLTEAEMHSIENLRGIPKGLNSDLHLTQIRERWDEFYEMHPQAAREQLLEQAAKIDDEFGSLFIPPVR
jgi:hypothetical protein